MIGTERISVAIKKARKKKKMSQEQLAEALDVTPTHIKHMESGRRLPSVEMLFRLASILGFSVDEMIDSIREDSHGSGKDTEELFSEITDLMAKCSESELLLIKSLVEAVIKSSQEEKR